MDIPCPPSAPFNPIKLNKTLYRRPDSSIYVDAKIRAAKAVGMKTALVDIPTEGLSPTALEAMVRVRAVCLPLVGWIW